MVAIAALAMTLFQDHSGPLPLWPSGNPGGWTVEGEEESASEGGILRLQNINTPTLEFFPANDPAENTPCVLVVPGGGYSIVAYGHEGTAVAQHLNKNGIHAAVLKYRLPKEGDKERHGPAFQDAQRAIRYLNFAKAEMPQLNIGKVGIMGFSAGGHLSATVSTQSETKTYEPLDDFDTYSTKPEFTALIYPAYLVDDQGNLKPEFKVNPQTPPTFLVHATNDGVTALSSLAYATALQKAKVPYSLHIYPDGGHGYGLNPGPADLKNWPAQLVTWLKQLK